MSSFHIRPRFIQVVEADPDTLREQIISRITEKSDRFEIRSFPGFVALRITEEDRHFWSPRLNLSLEEVEQGKTQVKGLYGPNAHMWSLFLFSYLILGFVAVGTLSSFAGYMIVMGELTNEHSDRPAIRDDMVLGD